MPDHLLSESQTIEGSWWVLGSDAIIAGTFDFTPKKMELRLHGNPTNNGFVGASGQEISILHGKTLAGEAVTLLRNVVIRSALSFGSGGSTTPTTVIPHYAIFGCWLDETDRIPMMRFRIPMLSLWYAQQFFSIQTDFSNVHEGSEPYSKCEVRLGERVSTYVPTIKANMLFGSSGTIPPTPALTSVNYEVTGWVEIKPDTPQDISWFLQQQYILTIMLAMISGKSMPPDLVTSALDAEDANGVKKKTTVSFLFSDSDITVCSLKNRFEFLLTKESLGQPLEEVVKRWFEVYQNIKDPCNLSMSTLLSDHLWIHVEFLSLMQALEGFHRARFDGDYMGIEEYEGVYKSMVEAIPPNISEDHRQALKSRVKYGNQISLRNRLKQLVGILQDDVKAQVLGELNPFINQLVNTRNYYSHWDNELLPHKLDFDGMNEAIVRLRLLLRFLFLDLLGIKITATSKVFESHHSDVRSLIYYNSIDS